MFDNKNKYILDFLKINPGSSSKEIFDAIQSHKSYATIKRSLSKLIEEKLIVITGKGKATKYCISPAFLLFQPIDIDLYYKKEIDNRKIKENFNLILITEVLNNVSLFTNEE